MKRKCIVIRWWIDDIKSIRPKFTDTQCMKVLRIAKEEHDAEVGINWGVLEHFADELFPNKNEAKYD